MSRRLRLAGLVFALLWAQWVLAMHGLEHAADAVHPHEEACAQCLVLAGSASAPPPGHVTPLPVRVEAPAPLLGVPPRLTFPPRTGYLTRAPPLLRS